MIGQHIPFSRVLNGKVNGVAISEAEYDLWDWRLMAEYRNEAGQIVQVFGITYEGIARANKAARDRITAARTRREADDSWSAEVERMVDRTP